MLPDDDDIEIEARQPEFLKENKVLPSWAASSGSKQDEDDGKDDTTSTGKRNKKKRQRNEELESVLASTAPLLDSKHQRTANAAPNVLSTLPLPKDVAKFVQWHRNGQLCVVGGAHNVYTFHAVGSFVEQLVKVDVGKRIQQMALTSSGEEAVVFPDHGFVPSLVHLVTQKVTPLQFLDTRENFAYRHNHRQDTHGRQSSYLTHLAVNMGDNLSRSIACSHGQTVVIGSLSAGTITHKITLSDPVQDVVYGGRHELLILAQDKVLFYDVRKTAKVLHELADEGSVGTSCLAVGPNGVLATGSSAGIVTLYQRGQTTPVKSFKNLTTSIDSLCFGMDRRGNQSLAMSTNGQKNGVRVAKLPACTVVPSFPAVGARHEFVQTVAFGVGAPILSLGEKGKVTNYVI